MKEKEFLEYNKLNILANLIEIEDHLRNLPRYYNPFEGDASCIIKHSAMIYGELGEAISHSTIVNQKEVEYYKKLRNEIVDFIKRVERREDPNVLLRRIREIRSEFSKVYLPSNEYRCKACNYSERILENIKNINTIDNQKNIMAISKVLEPIGAPIAGAIGMNSSEFAKATVPQFVGFLLEIPIDMFTTRLGEKIVKGLVGLGLWGASKFVDPDAKFDLVAMGTHLITEALDPRYEDLEVLKTEAERFGRALASLDLMEVVKCIFKVPEFLAPPVQAVTTPVVEVTAVPSAPAVRIA
jgi:hypothetical protein